MKYPILILLSLLLSACITYQDRNGNWQTQSAFKDLPAISESIWINVEVLPQQEWDEKCRGYVKYRGCTIANTIYVQGDTQKITMKLSPAYINALPNDQGRAGDMLAEKLGLELSFKDREMLGHEFTAHVIARGTGKHR